MHLMKDKYSKLTRTLVVADGEVWRDTGADVGETVGAVLGVASDVGGVLPDDLAEVAPLLEVGHVRAVLTVQARVVWLLAVVEQVSDDGRDVGRLDTSSDVLAVAATSNLTNAGSAFVPYYVEKAIHTCCERRRSSQQSAAQTRRDRQTTQRQGQSGWNGVGCGGRRRCPGTRLELRRQQKKRCTRQQKK